MGKSGLPDISYDKVYCLGGWVSCQRKYILIRSYLKIRIYERDQDEAEDQPTGILKYVEDLRRGLNADIGRKDFFEMASSQSPSDSLTALLF